jgi:outer membrane lipoprotein SlyB
VNGIARRSIGKKDFVTAAGSRRDHVQTKEFSAGAARNRIAGDAIVCSDRHSRMFVMKTFATVLAAALLSLAAPSADAKGCLKGAVVGGVAGHYAAHHGVLGAAAGCLYGRHRAKEQERQQGQQSQQAPAGQDKL